MAKRLVVSLSDEHYAWLEKVAKKRGLETVQDAARLILAERYEKNKDVQEENRV